VSVETINVLVTIGQTQVFPELFIS